MFARHTTTRMKGSGVVQGLKSLASKLHPQLPLSSKESQRLLTALTSSFRQRLDEAHPPQQAGGESVRPLPVATSNVSSGVQNLHSTSAAFADKHLASVLTNPLLATKGAAKKPALDYATAKIELQKNPAQDPISLLERYNDKGAATIPIATLCLETFIVSLNNLPEGQVQSEIESTGAGKRTLLWLWNSKLYETDDFADDRRLLSVMTPLVLKEGAEKYLWDWFRLDLSTRDQKGPSGDQAKGFAASSYHRYRWKGRLLRSIVVAKLEDSRDESADAALDAFCVACELKLEARRQGRDLSVPIKAAGMALEHALETKDQRYTNTDAARYDRFIASLKLYHGGEDKWGLYRAHEAWLHLFHPRNPSPLPALKVLKENFALHPSHCGTSAPWYGVQPKDVMEKMNSYKKMLVTAAQLQEDARKGDADWVLQRVHESYPKLSRQVDIDLREIRRSSRRAGPPVEEQEAEPKVHERVPFPSFV